jgi:hypothetical protein
MTLDMLHPAIAARVVACHAAAYHVGNSHPMPPHMMLGRGEIVENVSLPLPLDTPLLLVKPPVGLSTPEIFKALDLGSRSTADPLQVRRRVLVGGGPCEGGAGPM